MPSRPLAVGIVRALGLILALILTRPVPGAELPAPEPADAEVSLPADAATEAVATPEPLFAPAEFQDLVQAEVRRQLATARRTAYTPATDTAPPKGLRLYDSKQTGGFPFSANIEGFMQVRWFEFARGSTGWQNAAGQFEPINNINSFNINRFMITPYGYVVDERIIWSLTLFGTTDNGKSDAIVPLGVVGWKFNDNLSLTAGTTFVAGTREWIISNRWMQGVDRSMANTFFRPSYSPGVEANGSLADGLVTYRAGVWNSIQGATSGVLRKGTSMAWAGNL